MLKTVTVKLLDEVNVAIMGLKPQELKTLSDTFAVYAKNYVFHPLYKLKKWDGKIRYFSAAGATYYNLLPEILPMLKAMGYTVNYIDKRAYHNISIPKIDETYFQDWGVVLGEHQVTGINMVVEQGNGMLIAGTGAGKSIMTAALCDLYDRFCGFKVVVIVPNIDLIDQTAQEIRNFDIEVGTYSGTRKSLDENIIVSTWQSIQNNPVIMSQFQVVIVDECFDGDTKILMKDGWKCIKDIVPGDIVMNYSESGGVFKEDEVVEVYHNLVTSYSEDMFLLEFDNDIQIRVTGNHKFLTKNRGWVRADELDELDELVKWLHLNE
jgi:hypothetical protein